MDPDEEIAQLSKVFQNMGSPEKQARVMALQVSKRADQLAKTRGKGRLEALQHLMNLVISGRLGVSPMVKDSKNIEKTDTNNENLNDL